MSSNPIFFAPLRVPLVNLQTGFISREWLLLFQAIFNRVGGSTGGGFPDLAAALQDLSQSPLESVAAPVGAAELAPVQASVVTIEDLEGQIAQVRELLADLSTQVQGLKQGTVG